MKLPEVPAGSTVKSVKIKMKFDGGKTAKKIAKKTGRSSSR